jgi:uncharacterized glyoxalase superfamily protein PhnB
MGPLCPLLHVFDMPASLRFYRDVLGFEVIERSGEGDDVAWARLRHGGAELMLNTAYDEGRRPPRPDAARAGGHADILLYVACEDVDGAFAHLVANGVTVDPPEIAPYGMKQLHVTDPDGYGLCFQWPADRP